VPSSISRESLIGIGWVTLGLTHPYIDILNFGRHAVNTPSDTPVSVTAASTQLTPSYRLPLVILLIGGGLAFLQPGVGSVIALLGLFLLYQAGTIRLTFTNTELLVLRGDSILRHFPYQDWQTWAIYWPWLPILFYFREVNSIHFLPILFQPTELTEQLGHHCPETALLK
jgi:hypothetical protein